MIKVRKGENFRLEKHDSHPMAVGWLFFGYLD